MAIETQILSSLSNELVPGVCLHAFLPGIRVRNSRKIESEFHYQLCKTNPILSVAGGLQMNSNSFTQMAYENKSNWTLSENKPNSNPNQTQFKLIKVNFNAYQTQFKPKQTQSKPMPPVITVPATLIIDDCLHPAYNDNDNF